MEYNTDTKIATGNAVELAEFAKCLVTTTKAKTTAVNLPSVMLGAKRGRPKNRKNKSYSFEENTMVGEFLKDRDNYVAHKAGVNGLVLKGARVLKFARKIGRTPSGVKTHLNILRRENGVGFQMWSKHDYIRWLEQQDEQELFMLFCKEHKDMFDYWCEQRFTDYTCGNE